MQRTLQIPLQKSKREINKKLIIGIISGVLSGMIPSLFCDKRIRVKCMLNERKVSFQMFFIGVE